MEFETISVLGIFVVMVVVVVEVVLFSIESVETLKNSACCSSKQHIQVWFSQPINR